MIKILEIEKVDHHRIRGLATVEIRGLGRVHGIKIISGNYGLYCHVPDVKITDKNGDSVFRSLIVFEQGIWAEIREKVLEKYKKEIEEAEKDGRKAVL